MDLFGKEYAEHGGDIAKRIANEAGMLDLEKLFEQFPRLKFVDDLAAHHRFHHWELAFADVFAANGGFDLRRRTGRPQPNVRAAQPLGD